MFPPPRQRQRPQADSSPVINSPSPAPSTPAVTPAKPRILPPVKPEPAPIKPEPLWHVILIDDEDHTFDYVIEMMMAIFSHTMEKGLEIATTVNEHGRVICATVHKELAELRQEQIHEFGPDPRVKDCPGSMRAEIEPAE